jgi:hypothetical protein
VDERWPPYPALTAEHVQGARLFANRHDQIAGLPIDRGGRVAEIGVWRAAFSKVLVDLLKPSQFVAFDIRSTWSMSTATITTSSSNPTPSSAPKW